jgi:ABC-2 type transport system ATP-binding protein
VQVAQGEVYGVLGPNGAGKTTFLRMLFGLIRPDAGAAA